MDKTCNLPVWEDRKDPGGMLLDLVLEHLGISREAYLNPERDPALSELAAVVAILAEAPQPIHIVTDYDCDGVMAGVIMDDALAERHGVAPVLSCIRRFSEGYGNYGLAIEAMDKGTLVLTDHGIARPDLAEEARKKGLKVVIIDHHLLPENGRVPRADALLDPHVTGGAFRDYCAAGLCYRVAKALCPGSALEQHWAALAATATVADVVPLHGDNLNIVRDGLKAMRDGNVELGFGALLDAMGISRPTEDDLAFGIGPAVNASGRMADDGAKKVTELLRIRTPDAASADAVAVAGRATALAEDLRRSNDSRKTAVYELLAIVEASIKNLAMTLDDAANGLAVPGASDVPSADVGDPEHDPVLVVAFSGTDPRAEGIVGLVASRLSEQYGKPAIVLAPSYKDPTLMKGSGRSAGGVHLRHLLDGAKDLFVRYGGHPGAAGVTAKPENIGAIRSRLAELVEGARTLSPEDGQKEFLAVAASPADAPALVKEYEAAGPFGAGNPKPLVLFRGFRCSPVGGRKWAPMGSRGKAMRLFGETVDAVFFDGQEAYIAAGEPDPVDIVGSAFADIWRGQERTRIRGTEFRPCDVASPERWLAGELTAIFDSTPVVSTGVGEAVASASSAGLPDAGTGAAQAAPKQAQPIGSFLDELEALLKI